MVVASSRAKAPIAGLFLLLFLPQSTASVGRESLIHIVERKAWRARCASCDARSRVSPLRPPTAPRQRPCCLAAKVGARPRSRQRCAAPGQQRSRPVAPASFRARSSAPAGRSGVGKSRLRSASASSVIRRPSGARRHRRCGGTRQAFAADGTARSGSCRSIRPGASPPSPANLGVYSLRQRSVGSGGGRDATQSRPGVRQSGIRDHHGPAARGPCRCRLPGRTPGSRRSMLGGQGSFIGLPSGAKSAPVSSLGAGLGGNSK